MFSVLDVNVGRERLPQGITTLHWKTEAMRFVVKYFFRSWRSNTYRVRAEINMDVCLTGIVCFSCEYPERGGFVTYKKAEQMNVVLDHISKRFVRFWRGA